MARRWFTECGSLCWPPPPPLHVFEQPYGLAPLAQLNLAARAIRASSRCASVRAVPRCWEERSSKTTDVICSFFYPRIDTYCSQLSGDWSSVPCCFMTSY
ncbi:hypothetical protein E2C01_050636 [Portunus trituberculatus]|uniref:Uncharacterized protein n=1 Tax=Portunus trituberculatus TaxID=210409 RepID=A0A5B7G9I2_PORTR|nr:hypothetical protein [Portunus trituberculatus]